MNAASAGPVRKVAAGGLAAAIVTIVVWALQQFANITIPSAVAAALVTVVSFVVAYFIPAAASDYSLARPAGVMAETASTAGNR